MCLATIHVAFRFNSINTIISIQTLDAFGSSILKSISKINKF